MQAGSRVGCRCSIAVGADSQLSSKFLNYELRRHVRYEQGIGYRPKAPIFLQLPAKEMAISTPLIAAIKPDHRILSAGNFQSCSTSIRLVLDACFAASKHHEND